MSETKKYISIPTIDDCKLPNSLIRKCREVYSQYGKWKLYDLLNADLNNHTLYNKEQRDKFKNIELTRRYLYLYRKAMAETLSFAYNVDQTDLLDEETLEFDNTNVCPYCGRPLTLLTQIGSKKGFPKSHFNDVVKKYDKRVLFNKVPVRSGINITLSEFLGSINPGIQVGYSFAFWSFYNSDKTDLSELLVNPDNPTIKIDEEDIATMDPDSVSALQPQGNINLFKFLDHNKYITNEEGIQELNENYGKLTVYAVFKSDTDVVYTINRMDLTVYVNDVIDIYSSSLKIDNSNVYKPAFEFLSGNDKDILYDFDYMVIDTDSTSDVPTYVPENNYLENSDKLAADYVNDSNIDVIVVYSAKSMDKNEYNYANWDMSIRQLVVQNFKEPVLKDTVYRSKFAEDGKTIIPEEGSEEVVGVYNFFHWSLYEEGDVYILDDDNSKLLLRNIASILDNNSITVYALFKYDIKIGTYAYDDDCYSSLYHLYKGIDKAYAGYTDPDNSFVYEYKVNELFASLVIGEDELIIKKDHKRLPLASKMMYTKSGDTYELLDVDYVYKETVNGKETVIDIPYRITAEEYEALPDGLCRGIYDEQRSSVSYRGYPVSAGVGGGGIRYVKNNKIRVIRYNAISNNGVLSIENGKRTQHFSNMGDTGVELTYTTPGDFEIWYYLPRHLWYIYDPEIDDDRLNALQTTWVFNADPLNESKYRTTEPDSSEVELYTKFVSAKMITRTEYLTLTSENKRNCVIDRIYYEHQWENETWDETDQSGRVIATHNYEIQEIFNCKSISEYNTQVGTSDLSFGVDTKSYADMTRETFRIYQYHISLDKNVDTSFDHNQDNEIFYVENACGLEFDGDTWLFPITRSNRESFLKLILGADTQVVRNDSRFLRNGKIIFLTPDISDIINIPENETPAEKEAREALLDYTRLKPTDNTGINQMYYILTGLWKCVMFTNGYRLVYRAGDRNWPITGIEYDYVAKACDGEIQLKDLVYKYNASLRLDIEHSIDETNNLYYVLFKNITLVSPGASNYTFYNPSEENVVLEDTVASIAYTTKSDIIPFDDSVQYVKYSDKATITYGYGLSYMTHLTKDILRSYFTEDADNKARQFFEELKAKLIDPEQPDYYEEKVDGNGNTYYEKTDRNLRYYDLKNVSYDDLDDYHLISPIVFTKDIDGENFDAKKEYFKLVDNRYVPLGLTEYTVDSEAYKITGTSTQSYIKGVYIKLWWEDIYDLVTETTLINGIQIEKLKAPEYNPLLYRPETDIELQLRRSEHYNTYGVNPVTEETKTTKVIVEFSGKQIPFSPEDGSDKIYETSVYSKWGSSAVTLDNKYLVSGGYPNPSSNIRTDDPSDNQFIEEKTEFYANTRSIRMLSKSSVSYSGDTQSVIENKEDDSSGTIRNNDVKELDDRIWWNQFSKCLSGEAKNIFITDYGVNFSGWIWTGWKEGYIMDGDTVLVGGNTKKVEGGLIEAYPFESSNKANYVTQGFQRILFPKDVNSTFETEQYDTTDDGVINTHNRIEGDGLSSELVNKIDSETGEPLRLLRYCSNRSCEMYLKRLDKRKWSFRNRDVGVQTTNSLNSLYNIMALDEYLLPIGKDGSFKNYKATKFAATDPDKTAKFGISDVPKLVTVEPVDENTVEFGGWTLDKYPWHYGEDEATKQKYNEYVRYYLHRGGNALPDPFRFEFEWKYATNEFSNTKMSGYGNGSNLDDTTTQLDTIKQISHRTKNRIVPMETRSIPEYQQKYLDVLFNTFENVFIQLNTNSSPYSLFSQEEIYVMNEILIDLFTFNKDSDAEHMMDFIKFKLDIVTLMNDMTEYEFNLANYWHDGNYEYNKQLLEDFYSRTHRSSSVEELKDLSDVDFEKAVLGTDLDQDNPQTIFPFYSCKLTKDTWDRYENHPVRRIVIRREYTPTSNMTERDIINTVWGGDPSYTGYKFMGWYKDQLTFNKYYLDTSEGTTVITAGHKFVAYLRFDAGTYVNEEFVAGTNNILGTFEKALITFEEGNDIYLLFDVEDTPSRIWYIGEDIIKASLKLRLSELHEKLMLPTEFMCSLFNFIIAPKRYNIVESERGKITSLLVDSGAITTPSSKNVLSITRSADYISYKNAVISKPWNMATNEETGKSVKEQYYIIYNDNKFDAYSFFNEGWIKDVYGEENASAKFPLLRDTENPITHNSSGNNTLLNIIPFSTKKYKSALALVYDKGILLVNLTGIHTKTEDTQWIKFEDGSKILSPEKLFGSASLSIVDCKLDEYNGNNNLIIISDDSQIASFDLNEEKIYNPNVNYLTGVDYEELDSVRDKLPIMFKKTNAVNGRSVSLRKGRAVTVVGESAAALIGENEERYIEKRVGLTVLVGTLSPNPSGYNGDPWILMSKYADSGLPASLSDINYEKLSDIDKDKYKIHPKLTVQYAWDNSPLKNYSPDPTIDYEYIDVYTDEFDQYTEGTFKIYHNGNLISKNVYFSYTDELRKECKIYKITSVNYSFVRLSFSNAGTGFYDEEFEARLSKEKPLYAFYYKTGVEVDEHYGYKIQTTENIVDGIDTIMSDAFDEYLKTDGSNSSSTDFNKVKEIPGWKIVNSFTDYTKNVVDELDIIENIKKIFPVKGYVNSSTGKYVYQYVISDGYISQLIQWVDGEIRILSEYNFDDNNELLYVKNIDSDSSTYMIFKNQRIVKLETYEYVPNEISIPRMDKISFFVKTDNPNDETSISYVTEDKRLVNVLLNSSIVEANNPTIYNEKSLKDAFENIISLINCEIQQTEPFKYVSNYRRWHVLPGNDKSKLIEAQIN